jgi:hypothetical protein
VLQVAGHRAEEKIVKIILQSVHAEYRGDLCPVTNLMQQNVDNNLPWCCGQKIIQDVELLGSVPIPGRERAYEFPQFDAALPAKLEQSLDVVSRDSGRICKRPARESFNVSLLR